MFEKKSDLVSHQPSPGLLWMLLLVLLSAEVNADTKAGSQEATGKTQKSDITFFVLGDPQLHEDHLHTMVERIAAAKPDFVLIPGDCAMTGNPELPLENFFKIFAPLYPKPNTLLYAIPGNHDIDHGLAVDGPTWLELWDLPEPKVYYSFTRKSVYVAGLCVTARSLFRKSQHDWPVPLGDSPASQLEWLDEDLKSLPPSIQWKFLFHHEPGPRYCYNGSDGWGVSNYLEPMAYDAGVDIIFRGHIHCYERTYPINIDTGQPDPARGLTMITTGGGTTSFFPPHPDTPLAHQPLWFDAVVANERLHYCRVVITGNHLKFEAIDLNENVFDQFEITKSVDGHRTWSHLPKECVVVPKPKNFGGISKPPLEEKDK